MTPFAGRAIGLGFALLWLFGGASALASPWSWIVGMAGLAAIGLLAIRAWRAVAPRTGRFRGGRYGIAVALEFGALAAAGPLLGRAGLGGYLIPVAGMIVGLHFIGLWWAGGGASFLWLAGAMTAIDAGALLLPPGSAAMQAAAGLGSAAALALTAGMGGRR